LNVWPAARTAVIAGTGRVLWLGCVGVKMASPITECERSPEYSAGLFCWFRCVGGA